MSEFVAAGLCRHPALFYEPTELRLITCAAFVRRELDRDNRVLYLSTPLPPRSGPRFGPQESTSTPEQRTGTSRPRTPRSPTPKRGFDPERMAADLEARVEKAAGSGYSGLSVAGENTWCFHTDYSFDHSLDFEARFDDRTSEFPGAAAVSSASEFA